MLARSVLVALAALGSTQALFLSNPDPSPIVPPPTTPAIRALALGLTPRGGRDLVARQAGGVGAGFDPTACVNQCSASTDASALQAIGDCTTPSCQCTAAEQLSPDCLGCILTQLGIDIPVADFNQQCLALSSAGTDCSSTCSSTADLTAVSDLSSCAPTDTACACSAVTTLASDPPCLQCLIASAAISADQEAAIAQQCGIATGNTTATGGATSSGIATGTATGGAVTPSTSAIIGSSTPIVISTPSTSVSKSTSVSAVTTSAKSTTSSIASTGNSTVSASASASSKPSAAGTKVGGAWAAVIAVFAGAVAAATLA